MGLAVPVAGGVPAPAGRRRWALFVGAAATAAATALAFAIAATGASPEHAQLVALGRAAMVGVPCSVGLYAWWRRPGEHFGLVLVVVGGVWAVVTLGESADPAAYAVGRVAGWLAEVLIVFLVLSFPTGRLPARIDRMLVAAMAAVVAIAFLPRLVLAASFEVPTPFTSCTADCPANPLFGFAHEPAFVEAILRPLGTVLVLAVMLAVVARLWSRIVASSPHARRIFVPVLAIALARTALLGAGISVRSLDPEAQALEVVAWLLALAVPALAVAFLAGLLRGRVFTAGALGRLAVLLGEQPGRAGLRPAFAQAFGDPRVDVAFPTAGGWADAQGRAVALPVAGDGRTLTEVPGRNGPAAAVIHDEALAMEPQLLRAGTALASTALERGRLEDEAKTAMREVRRSRARIVASADRERRRLERDLHDGAQQRLVALRIELGLAEDLVRRDPTLGAARLHELEVDVDEAIAELRALAHGVYPPLLADRGLGDALRAVTRRSPLRVDVLADDLRRYRSEVESAVYFVVLEACQNALKHARGAHRVQVELHELAGELSAVVRDDGCGFDGTPPAGGAGVASMRERIAAVGGTLELASALHVGTVLRVRVPVAQEVS